MLREGRQEFLDEISGSLKDRAELPHASDVRAIAHPFNWSLIPARALRASP